jgi:nifR3 family TIM-barrel protein
MDFRGKLILAPLAGITDTTFRRLCRENGADIVVTEMVSAKGLLMQPGRSMRYLAFDPAERPIGAQLFGAVPSEMGEAAAAIGELGFDFVDINMGCPVRKVTGGGAGAALLSDPALCGRIVAEAVRQARIPVTVKIRSGFAKGTECFLEVAGEAYSAGAAAVTLHPRTRNQMFSGDADWSHIARLKAAFPERVVIGNGDVRRPGDAARMVAETGCDAVMIGRAALGNPWIFGEAFVPGHPAFPQPTPEARRALILRHGAETFARHGAAGIVEMRKHLAWYSRGIPGGAAFRAELVRVASIEAFEAAVERLF